VEPPADAPPPPPPAAGPPPAAEARPPPEEPPRCQRCGAPHDPYQEYCLECGARLARPAPARGSVLRREMWTRDSPLFFWATFLALLLVALVASMILLAATRDGDDDQPAPTQAAGPTTSVLTVPTEIPTEIPTETFPGTGTLTDTLTVPTLPTTGTTTGVTPPPAGGDGRIISWPASTSGYTVILSSIRESRGRSAAETAAREAISKRLNEVGILNSSDYSSLNSGYFVVFSGIHDTEAEGRNALSTVRQSSYPIAYLREITP
jgi:hypothetical protein